MEHRADAINQMVDSARCCRALGESTGHMQQSAELPVSLTDQLWCYSVGVARRPGNATLLAKVDSFIEQFHSSPRRAEIERTWQGEVLDVPAFAQRLKG